MGSSRKAGIFGIAGVVVLLICAVIGAAAYEGGPFSPANRFLTELGYYERGYFVMSPAFIFNIGMIISGLLLCVFAVMHGIRKDTPLDTASGFFGIVAGILISLQGVITLNYSKTHLLLSGVFFAAVFLMCLFTVIAQVRYSDSSITALVFAFIAGAAGAFSSVLIFTGGLNKIFQAGAAYEQRADVLPGAIIQWAVYVMLLLLYLVQSTSTLAGEYEPEDDSEDDYGLTDYKPRDNSMPKTDLRRAQFKEAEEPIEEPEPEDSGLEDDYEPEYDYRPEADHTPEYDYKPDIDYTPQDYMPEPKRTRGRKRWGTGRDIEL